MSVEAGDVLCVFLQLAGIFWITENEQINIIVSHHHFFFSLTVNSFCMWLLVNVSDFNSRDTVLPWDSFGRGVEDVVFLIAARLITRTDVSHFVCTVTTWLQRYLLTYCVLWSSVNEHSRHIYIRGTGITPSRFCTSHCASLLNNVLILILVLRFAVMLLVLVAQCIRIDPLRFMAGCRTRRLNQV